MSKSGIEFVFAAFAIVLIVFLITGALDPFPRAELALITVSCSLLAASGIYARFAIKNRTAKNELIAVLLFCAALFLGGVIGAVWPRDSRAVTPYLSGLAALADLVFAGYWVRRYLKKTRP